MSDTRTSPADKPDATAPPKAISAEAKRAVVTRKLQAYYQFECLRPTTARLQLLLDEMMQRGSAVER